MVMEFQTWMGWYNKTGRGDAVENPLEGTQQRRVAYVSRCGMVWR